ncbi:hypothetical protein ABPG74_020823 [Tetrahymena malaccensis]
MQIKQQINQQTRYFFTLKFQLINQAHLLTLQEARNIYQSDINQIAYLFNINSMKYFNKKNIHANFHSDNLSNLVCIFIKIFFSFQFQQFTRSNISILHKNSKTKLN